MSEQGKEEEIENNQKDQHWILGLITKHHSIYPQLKV